MVTQEGADGGGFEVAEVDAAAGYLRAEFVYYIVLYDMIS